MILGMSFYFYNCDPPHQAIIVNKREEQGNDYDDYRFHPPRLGTLAAFVVGSNIDKPHGQWQKLKRDIGCLNLPTYLGHHLLNGCESIVRPYNNYIYKVLDLFIELIYQDTDVLRISSFLFRFPYCLQEYFSRVYASSHYRLHTVDAEYSGDCSRYTSFSCEHILKILLKIKSNLTRVRLHKGCLSTTNGIFSRLSETSFARNTLSCLELSYLTLYGDNWPQLVKCVGSMSNLKVLKVKSVCVICNRCNKSDIIYGRCPFFPLPILSAVRTTRTSNLNPLSYKLEELVFRYPTWLCGCHTSGRCSRPSKSGSLLFDRLFISYPQLKKLDIVGLFLTRAALRVIGSCVSRLEGFNQLNISDNFNYYNRTDINDLLFGEENKEKRRKDIKIIGTCATEHVLYHMSCNSIDEYHMNVGSLYYSLIYSTSSIDMVIMKKLLSTVMTYMGIKHRFEANVVVMRDVIRMMRYLIDKMPDDSLPTYDNFNAWLVRGNVNEIDPAKALLNILEKKINKNK